MAFQLSQTVGEQDATHTQDAEATGEPDAGLGTGHGAWTATSADRCAAGGDRPPAPPTWGRGGADFMTDAKEQPPQLRRAWAPRAAPPCVATGVGDMHLAGARAGHAYGQLPSSPYS